MIEKNKVRTVLYFLLLVVFVVGLSIISTRLWRAKPEKVTDVVSLSIKQDMTLEEFGNANNLPGPVLKEIFELQSRSDMDKKLTEFGAAGDIESEVMKKLALVSERQSKNWYKIAVKFLLWFAFLLSVFVLLKKRKATQSLRAALLLASILVFGVVFGPDPGPMGTVKDAVHLYGSSGAVFPPRMIALALFLFMVFIANKYICAWGCQAGVLQDMIFRINNDDKHRTIVGKKVRLPFVFTNTVRIAVFLVFTAAVFLWGVDIYEPVDLFKIYNPLSIGIGGAFFTGALLLGSLFVYRPWCHLFCPFGLAGWIVEKFSFVKIRVDYDTCIACKKCSQACPSTVMSAILLRDKGIIPDCFACYACRDVCPTGSIFFSAGKRSMPPEGHFDR